MQLTLISKDLIIFFNCSDMKVVDLFARKPYAYFANQYYPPMVQLDTLIRRLRARGLYKDEHMDFQELMYEQRKARGKGKPRKGT